MVLEWIDDSGERWITRGYSSSLPQWTAKGLLHEGLFGDWKEDD